MKKKIRFNEQRKILFDEKFFFVGELTRYECRYEDHSGYSQSARPRTRTRTRTRSHSDWYHPAEKANSYSITNANGKRARSPSRGAASGADERREHADFFLQGLQERFPEVRYVSSGKRRTLGGGQTSSRGAVDLLRIFRAAWGSNSNYLTYLF